MKKLTNIIKTIVLLLFMGQSIAANAEGVSLGPATLVVPAAGVTFAVNVLVTGAMDLGGLQFDIKYNPAIVHVVAPGDVVLGAFPASTGRTVTALAPSIDNVAGKITFGAFSFGAAAGPNGNGTLATVTFTVQAPAAGALTLAGVIITDTGAIGRPVAITGGTTLTFNTAPAPTAPALAVNEDTAGTSQVAHNDPDVGDTHTYAVTTAAANGTATVNAAGLATYTPNLNFNGTDSFIVTVTDAAGATGTVTINVTINAVNDAPTASGVTISGTAIVGNTLNGTYTYADVESDPEGVSTFRWLRNGVAIAGATASTYTLIAADSGKTIKFEVTPVAATGATPGMAVASAGTVIANSAPHASGSGGGCAINPTASFDPTMLGMLLLSGLYGLKRRKRLN